MANILDFLGALKPNQDGSQNALQRFNTAINPERQMQQVQMLAAMQELQQKQAVQSALQQWAQKGGGDPKSLYGALASTGDMSALSKFTDLVAPKLKTETMGNNLVQFDENNPTIPPKVVYTQPTKPETTTVGGNIIQYSKDDPTVKPKVIYSQTTPDERKLNEEEKKKLDGAQMFGKKLERLNSLYDDLHKNGGIRSTADTSLQSLSHTLQGSEGIGWGNFGIPGGQFFGKAFSTKNQQTREEIQKEQAALLPLYMQAQGITPGMERAVTAQQLLNKALPDLGKAYESNKENIKSLRDLVPEANITEKPKAPKYKEGQKAKWPDGSIKVFSNGAWR